MVIHSGLKCLEQLIFFRDLKGMIIVKAVLIDRYHNLIKYHCSLLLYCQLAPRDSQIRKTLTRFHNNC